MKVALSLEITDEQRSNLAQMLAGKPTKRLATRDEVREFCEGSVGALAAATVSTNEEVASQQSPRFAIAPKEEELAAQLRADGKSESYIRGYLVAGRK